MTTKTYRKAMFVLRGITIITAIAGILYESYYFGTCRTAVGLLLGAVLFSTKDK